MQNLKTKHAAHSVKPGYPRLFHKTCSTFCWAPGSDKKCTRRSKMCYVVVYGCDSTCRINNSERLQRVSVALQCRQATNYAHQKQDENMNKLVEDALTRLSLTETSNMKVPRPQESVTQQESGKSWDENRIARMLLVTSRIHWHLRKCSLWAIFDDEGKQ